MILSNKNSCLDCVRLYKDLRKKFQMKMTKPTKCLLVQLFFFLSCSNAPLAFSSKVCYVKFRDPSSVGVAQHLTNTVFIDRALIVVPCAEGWYLPCFFLLF